jgi:hypothetical protein
MSIQSPLGTLVLCLTLLLRLIASVPMQPEELENLMHSMNQRKVLVTVPEENQHGGFKLPKLPEDGE